MAPADQTASLDGDELLAHLQFARRLARAMLSDQATADDVAQQAMLVALEKSPGATGSVRAWLAGTVRKLAFNHFRGEARRRNREETATQAEMANHDRWTATAVERMELRQELVQAVLSLREPYRTVVVLRYMEELTPTEISEALKQPIGTVKSQLQRGIRMLREHYENNHSGSKSWQRSLACIALPAPAASASTTLIATIAAVALLSTAATWAWVSHKKDPPLSQPVAALPTPSPAALGSARPGPAIPPDFKETLRIETEAISGSILSGSTPSGSTPSNKTHCILTVADPNGLALSGASIRILSIDGGEQVATTDKAGHALLDRKAGQQLLVQREGFRPSWRTYSSELPERDRVELEATELRTLRIIDAHTGLGIPDAEVRYRLDGFDDSPDHVLDEDYEEDEDLWTAIQLESLGQSLTASTKATDLDGVTWLPRAPCTDLVVEVPHYLSKYWHVHDTQHPPGLEFALQPAAQLQLTRRRLRNEVAHAHVSSEKDHHHHCLIAAPGEDFAPVDLNPGVCTVQVISEPADREFVDLLCVGQRDQVSFNAALETLAGRVERHGIELEPGSTHELELFADNDQPLTVTVRGTHVPEGATAAIYARGETDELSAVAHFSGWETRFDHVADGDYLFQVSQGSTVLAAGELTVPGPGGNRHLEVDLQSARLQLELTNLGRTPHGLLDLHLCGEVEHRSAIADIDPNGKATFDFEGLVPGSYRVEFSHGSRWVSHRIEVTENQPALSLSLADSITHGCTIRLRDPSGVRDWSVRWTDADGHALPLYSGGHEDSAPEVTTGFELAAGRYFVVATFGAQCVTASVEIDGSTEVSLGSTETFPIRLDLKDAANRPIAWTDAWLLQIPDGAGTDRIDVALGLPIHTEADGQINVALPEGRFRIETDIGLRGDFTVSRRDPRIAVSVR